MNKTAETLEQALKNAVNTIDSWRQRAERAEAEAASLRQQRDEARAEFDSLGPTIEAIERANIYLKAENTQLLQSRNEQLDRANKLQLHKDDIVFEREDRLRFEVKDLHRRLAAAEARLMEIAEVLTATNVVSDFDDPVRLAHSIAEYCQGHHPASVPRRMSDE